MFESEEQVQDQENKKKPQYETTLCPRCGRISPVTLGYTLVACWRCAMTGANRIGAGEARESELYDWPATIANLKIMLRASKEKAVAFKLDISESHLSEVKHGLRPMPKEVLKLIRSNWPGALKTAQKAGEDQATEKPQDGPNSQKPAIPVQVCQTPVFGKNIPLKNNKFQDQKSKSVTSQRQG